MTTAQVLRNARDLYGANPSWAINRATLSDSLRDAAKDALATAGGAWDRAITACES